MVRLLEATSHHPCYYISGINQSKTTRKEKRPHQIDVFITYAIVWQSRILVLKNSGHFSAIH